MKTATKTPVAKWMDENGLTIESLAYAVAYSHGAVAKWRQDDSYPANRAVLRINAVGKRHGWTKFPEAE
jgi:DNA-binding transcriptional regulator YiaG